MNNYIEVMIVKNNSLNKKIRKGSSLHGSFSESLYVCHYDKRGNNNRF